VINVQYYHRLKELRIDNDYTQQYIASLLNVKQEYYSRYELGKIPLPIKHLKTLCLLYNVSADYIIGLPKNLKWPR